MVGRNYRHDRLRDALAQLLKMCYPDAEVSTEHPVPGLPAIGGDEEGNRRCRVRADVYMREGASVTVFDVAIVNPSAQSYLVKGSDVSCDVAATHRETLKRESFLKRMGPHSQISFVPFVVEATGRMGPAALDFYNRRIAEHTERWKGEQFLAKMSSIIAQWNARLILETRALLQAGNRQEAYPSNTWNREQVAAGPLDEEEDGEDEEDEEDAEGDQD